VIENERVTGKDDAEREGGRVGFGNGECDSKYREGIFVIITECPEGVTYCRTTT